MYILRGNLTLKNDLVANMSLQAFVVEKKSPKCNSCLKCQSQRERVIKT